MTYEKLLKQMEMLQRELMDIEDYSEDVYQAMQSTIDELEYIIDPDPEDD